MTFGECCGPLLQGKQFAVDAEALMRSRYTAYVLGDAAYLRRSWHPDTCPADLSLDAGMQWPLWLMVLGTHVWFVGSLLASARADNLLRESGKDWVLASRHGAGAGA